MKLSLVLLAAGNSRRFKSNKLLYSLAGKPLYRHITDAVAELPEEVFYEKIAVTQYSEIERSLKQRGYRVLINPRSEEGIASSIGLAMGAISSMSDGFCFAVADQPYLKSNTILEFVRAFEKSGKGIGSLCSVAGVGNPTIFRTAYHHELRSLCGDVGGRKIIRKYPEDVYLHQIADPLELLDIDECHEQ